MKLVINYDFFNAVLNVNENFTPLKLVRNNKRLYSMYYLPFFLIGNFLSTNSLVTVLKELIIEYGFVIGTELLAFSLSKTDIYKNKSISDLKKLAGDLRKLFVKTDYDLLLNSELNSKKIKININKEVFNIMEHKYILVPSYDFNNNIKMTSILQEHVIGSDEYILSIGSPSKSLKLAYSNT